MPGIRAFPLDTADPGDVSGLRRLFDDGTLRAEDVVCIVGKTEGNGGRNDFTRQLATTALEHLFAPRLGCAPEQVQDRVVFSLSGGTEGVVTPHIIVFAREDSAPTPGEKRLAVATGATRDFAPRRDRPAATDHRDRPARSATSSRPSTWTRPPTSTWCR